jgi:hypothetical protein
LLSRIVVCVGTWTAEDSDMTPGEEEDDFGAAAVGDRNPPREGVVAGRTAAAAPDGGLSAGPRSNKRSRFVLGFAAWGAIHQLLNIILQLRILVLLLLSTLPYVVKVENYS